MDYLIYLVIIVAVIILSEISLFLSKQMNLEGTVIVPLTVGVILNALFTKDRLSINLSELNPIFLTITGICLIFFVFDATSKMKVKQIDTSYTDAFKLFIITLILNVTILTYIIIQITGINIFMAILFSLIFTSTSPIFFNDWPSKIREVLSKETIIATPILLLLGYFIYDTLRIQRVALHFFAPSMQPYTLELIIGLGAGLLTSIIFFNTVKRFYKNKISYLFTILFALTTYLLAEFLGGDGVISVAVFAFIFGNMHLINKEKTTDVLEKIMNPLYIILILILGFSAGLNITLKIFIESLILLLIILFIRFISSIIVFRKNHTSNEKLHLTLNTQHGASLILILLLLTLRGVETQEIIQLSLLILIYTGIISSVASYHDHKQKSKEKENLL